MGITKQGSRGSLADRMKDARVKRAATQAQLADLLHVKQATVSMFEAGELSAISDDLAQRIQSWIDSGKKPPQKAKRGPYKKDHVSIRR